MLETGSHKTDGTATQFELDENIRLMAVRRRRNWSELIAILIRKFGSAIFSFAITHIVKDQRAR